MQSGRLSVFRTTGTALLVVPITVLIVVTTPTSKANVLGFTQLKYVVRKLRACSMIAASVHGATSTDAGNIADRQNQPKSLWTISALQESDGGNVIELTT